MASADAGRGRVRLLASLTLVVSLAALALGEQTLLRLGDPVCSFRAQTGRPCMGCGGTHAFGRVARGDVAGALSANPLGAFVGMALWGLALAGAGSALTGRSAYLSRALGLVLALAPGALLGNAAWWWKSLG